MRDKHSVECEELIEPDCPEPTDKSECYISYRWARAEEFQRVSRNLLKKPKVLFEVDKTTSKTSDGVI